MKNILVLSVTLALFTACGNKTSTKEENKDSTTVDEKKADENNTDEKAKAHTLNMEDLAGTWEQSATAENEGVSATEKLTLVLKADGNFTKTVSAATNIEMMGMKAPSASENGRWTLNAKTVNLGGLAKLEYHEDLQTLVNAADGISLVRK